MQDIKHTLESQDGVDDVRLNPTAGSATIRYDRRRHSTAGILSLLEDLDVIVESVGQEAAFEKAGAMSGESVRSTGFLEAINDLNARIYAATGIPIDLKIALPLLFLGAGVWSIGRKGLMIESVPGWLFLWFAFDMFVKLHPSRG